MKPKISDLKTSDQKLNQTIRGKFDFYYVNYFFLRGELDFHLRSFSHLK